MPGSRNCRYSLGRAGQRAAEQVREHQHEHDREHGHVEQLLGHVLDLEQRPPAEGRATRRARRARRPRSAASQDGRAARRARCGGCVVGGGRSCGTPVGSSVSRRRGGRSGPGTPRPGWAGRGRSRRRRCRRAASVGERRGARPRAGSPTPGGQRRRVGSRLTADAERAARAPLRRRPRCVGSAQPDVQGAGADRRLQLAAGALGDHPAVVDDGDAGRPAGRPRRGTAWSAARWCRSATSARTISHTWLRLRGSRPVVGSSRKSSSGVHDDAGGDVEPPAHAAGVGLDLPVAGLGRGRTRRAARSARARAAARE